MPDNSIDSILCMRLLHHIADAENRLKILREFHRVTKDTVILSMWVDGNIQANNRKKLEQRRSHDGEQNRLIITAQQAEQEYHQAGFSIIRHIDLLPKVSMWRFYILKKNPDGEIT